MSLFRRTSNIFGPTPQEMVNDRRALSKPGIPVVTSDTAMRHSAVWACLRLRANLVSTMPVDVFRRINGEQIEVPKPPVLVNPGGERVDIQEWLYSSQVDLDRGGNVFGLITERDGMGMPRRIDLQPLNECAFVVRDGKEWYRIGGKLYAPKDVWHERQYTVSGLPVGLSPVAYAAWSISEYLSIQDFALDWFGNGGVPLAHLKNTAKTLTSDQSSTIKERYTASVRSGEILVTGSDWEYDMIQADQAGSAWLEAKQFSIGDIARFFDCPGDLIDAVVTGGHITYATVTERNLQFLIMHLGPTVTRRENALGKLLSKPRYVKLNSDALLRMDPKAAAELIKVKIDSRTMTPDEARELDNKPALTQEQIDQFLTFWPPKAAGSSSEPVQPASVP